MIFTVGIKNRNFCKKLQQLTIAVDSLSDCRSRGLEFEPQPAHIASVEIAHEIISTAILPHRLI